MRSLFIVCIGVGAGYTLISFVIGQVVDALDFDSEFDIGSTVSPFKPSIIAAFLTVFGGAGLIFINHMGILPALSSATFMGLAVAYLLYRFIITPLYKAQNTSVVEKQSLIGLTVKVTEYIPQGKYGKITYYVNGNTYSAPAKSEDGNDIGRSEQAEIMYIDKNTFFVRKK